MPYFYWKGIDLLGQVHKGKLFARSANELDALLLKQEIALLENRVMRPKLAFSSITMLHKIDFFSQLAHLLATGVLIPDALVIVGSQINNIKFQTIISDIALQVQQGQTLSYAVQRYPQVFSSLMVCVLEAGQESGDLVHSLQLLRTYLSTMHEFNKKIRTALFVPASTLIFFCIISVIIFTLIIPQFVSIFQSTHAQLPRITQIMIDMSSFLTSIWAAISVGTLGVTIILLKLVAHQQKAKLFFDALKLQLPILGSLLKDSYLAYFLFSVSMLLKGGMQLVPAIKIAQNSVSNGVIKNQLAYICQEVESGYSLSMAMLHDPEQIFDPEVISMVRIGEESSKLISLLDQAALWYQDKVKRVMQVVTLLINPLLMLIMGLLVTLLIFSVYMPLFNMAHIIQ